MDRNSKIDESNDPEIVNTIKNLKNYTAMIKQKSLDSQKNLENAGEVLRRKRSKHVETVKNDLAVKQKLDYEEVQKSMIQTKVSNANEILNNIKTGSRQLDFTLNQSQCNLAAAKQFYEELKKTMNKSLNALKAKDLAIKKELYDTFNEEKLIRQEHKAFTQQTVKATNDIAEKINSFNNELHILSDQIEKTKTADATQLLQIDSANQRHVVLQKTLAAARTEEEELLQTIAYKKQQLQMKKKEYSSRLSDRQSEINKKKICLENLVQEIENKTATHADLLPKIENETTLISKLKVERDQLLVRSNKIESTVLTNSNQFELDLQSKAFVTSCLKKEIDEKATILTALNTDIISVTKRHEELLDAIKVEENSVQDLKEYLKTANTNLADAEQTGTRLLLEQGEVKKELAGLKFEIEIEEQKMNEFNKSKQEKHDNFIKLQNEKCELRKSFTLEYQSLGNNFIECKNKDLLMYNSAKQQIEIDRKEIMEKTQSIEKEIQAIEEKTMGYKAEIGRLEMIQRNKNSSNKRRDQIDSDSDTSTEGVVSKLRNRSQEEMKN